MYLHLEIKQALDRLDWFCPMNTGISLNSTKSKYLENLLSQKSLFRI